MVLWKDKCGCHCAQQFLRVLWCLVRRNLTLLSETRITFGCCGTLSSTPLWQDEAGRSALWIRPLCIVAVWLPPPHRHPGWLFQPPDCGTWQIPTSVVSWTRELIPLKRKVSIFLQIRILFLGEGWVTFVLFLKLGQVFVRRLQYCWGCRAAHLCWEHSIS